MKKVLFIAALLLTIGSVSIAHANFEPHQIFKLDPDDPTSKCGAVISAGAWDVYREGIPLANFFVTEQCVLSNDDTMGIGFPWKLVQVDCPETCVSTYTWGALTDGPGSWTINWEPRDETQPPGYAGSYTINTSADCTFSHYVGAVAYWSCSYTFDQPSIPGGYNVWVIKNGTTVVPKFCLEN